MKKTLLLLSIVWANISLHGQLSGAYTIDASTATGGTNYQTFGEFATALNTDGISGPVTANVKDGIYTENVTLNNITGASATNRIVIQADPGNSFPVALKGLANNSGGAALRLVSTKFLTVKGLHFQTNTGTYPRLIYTSGTLEDINFSDCVFQGIHSNTTTSTNYSMIYCASSAFKGSGLTLSSCTGANFSYLMYSLGVSSNHSTNLTVLDCDFRNLYRAGFYSYYFDNFTMTNTKLYFKSSSSFQYGLRLYGTRTSSLDRMDIQKNDIQMNTTSTVYGIITYYYGAPSSNPSIIANNFIQNLTFTGTGSRYLFYPISCGNLDVHHNTFLVRDGGTSSRVAFFSSSTNPSAYTPGGYNVHNNIFANTAQTSGAGSVFYANTTAANYFDNISNNLYYFPNSSSPFYFKTTSYSDYASFASASGDLNSQYGDPDFLSPTDLHIEGLLAYDEGLNTLGINEDFDGDVRPLAPSTMPDIGADEFILPSCPKPVNFEFIGGTTTSAILEWKSANASEWEIEYGPVGFTQGAGTKEIALTNPTTLNSLTPRSLYHVYIRSICGPGDTSKVAGPILINTYDQGPYMVWEATCGPGFIDVSDSVPALALNYGGEVGFGLAMPILYQGEVVDKITIGLNGGVLFNTTSGQVSSTINGSYPNGVSWFPFCQTLDNDKGGVHYKLLGTAPNRQMVIQYDSIPDYPGNASSNPGTFEIIYDEATTEFYFIYEDVNFGPGNASFGGDAEIGVRGPKQSVDISKNNTNFLTNNSCIRWFYVNCPNPEDLIIVNLESDEATVDWNPGIANETEWFIKYGPKGFDTSTVSSILWTDSDFTFTGLDERTTYEVIIYAKCNNGFVSSGNVLEFTTPPHCANPRLITAQTSVDSVFSNWNWSPNNDDPNYDLLNYSTIHGLHQFNPRVDGILTLDDDVTGDTIIDPTLMSGGVYDLYVIANCGSGKVSDTVGPVQFTMPVSNESPCDAVVLPVDKKTRFFDNTGTTANSDEQLIAPPVTGGRTTDGWEDNDVSNTTWFKFTAPASGQIRISGAATVFDGQYALYETGDCANIPSMTFVAANDHEIDGTNLAPNFTLCDVVPGQEYYLMHDSYSDGVTGKYSVLLYEIDFEAGFDLGKKDVCALYDYNLFESIDGYTQGGTWVDIYETDQLVDDSIFLTSNVSNQVFPFEYRFEDGCAADSVKIEVEVHRASDAGEDGSKTVCKNEPFNLYHALDGIVDHDGDWFDYQNQPMKDGDVLALTVTLPGTYNYKYVVGNGVCPRDTVDIIVTVSNLCDYMGLDDIEMSGYTLYPNPTADAFVIESDSKQDEIEILLFDSKGKLVKLTEHYLPNGLQRIDISGLARGVYVIRLEDGTSVSTARIIKN